MKKITSVIEWRHWLSEAPPKWNVLVVFKSGLVLAGEFGCKELQSDSAHHGTYPFYYFKRLDGLGTVDREEVALWAPMPEDPRKK
jgi:hypothetical protein